MTYNEKSGAVGRTVHLKLAVPRRVVWVSVLFAACLSFSADAAAQGQLQAVGAWLWEHSFGVVWGRMNGQRSIRLYGRVVDQHGQPVEDVEVDYAAVGSFLANGTGHDRVRTDAKGGFVIRGARGVRLVIDGLYKPGYAFKFADGRGRWFEQPSADPKAEDWHIYSARNPYTYRIWKISDLTKKSEKLFEEMHSFHPVPDGRWYSLRLRSSIGDDLLSKGESRFADLFVSTQRHADSLTVTMRGNGGGLLPEVDGQAYEAPSQGYQPIWTHTTQSLREDGTEHRFYFKSVADGRMTYGRVTFSFTPALQPRKNEDFERAGVMLSYSTNRREGRELVAEPWRP